MTTDDDDDEIMGESTFEAEECSRCGEPASNMEWDPYEKCYICPKCDEEE
jgi:hypothetical protein